MALQSRSWQHSERSIVRLIRRVIEHFAGRPSPARTRWFPQRLHYHSPRGEPHVGGASEDRHQRCRRGDGSNGGERVRWPPPRTHVGRPFHAGPNIRGREIVTLRGATDGRDRRRRGRRCGSSTASSIQTREAEGPQLTELSPKPLAGWRYGIHPKSVGMQIRFLGRVELPLGEALRLEMGDAQPRGEDVAHIQYYIWTEGGAWALWLSCARRDLAGRGRPFARSVRHSWIRLRPVPLHADDRAGNTAPPPARRRHPHSKPRRGRRRNTTRASRARAGREPPHLPADRCPLRQPRSLRSARPQPKSSSPRVDVADGTGARAVRDLGPFVADDRHPTSPPLQATESL